MGFSGDESRRPSHGANQTQRHAPSHARYQSSRARSAGSTRSAQARTAQARSAQSRPTGRQEPRLASDSEQISTIGAGQGARLTTRENASEAADYARHNVERRYAERHPEARAQQAGPKRSALNVVLLVVAGILVVLLVFVLGTLVNSALFPPETDETTAQDQTLHLTEAELQAQQEQAEQDAGQEQVGTDGTVSYGGETYALQQDDDGTWALINAVGDVLISLEGMPIALARSADVLLVPENRDGAWDVVSYVVGGHLDGVTYVVGSDGEPVRGSAEAVSVELDGTTLRVTDTNGTTTDVALE